MEYLVVYEQSNDSWGAYVPDLPGLGVVGTSLDEVKRLIEEGIPLHLQALKEHGDPIPRPSAKSDYVVVNSALLA